MIFTDFAPNERSDDAALSLRLLLRPWIWQKGKALSRVRTRLKAYFPESDVFLFLTGRAGLFHLLQSFQFPTGSKVLVQAFTCEAVILPILQRGFTPQYVDIEEKTFSMELDDLKKKYTAECKVLILQHTYGLIPEERAEILQFAKANKLMVVEDMAHGFDPNFTKKDKAKTTKLLSFGRSKAFSSVFGGAIVTNISRIQYQMSTVEKRIPQPTRRFIYKILLYKPLVIFIRNTYRLLLGKIAHFLGKHSGLLIDEVTQTEKRGEYDMLLDKSYPNAFAALLHRQLNKFDQMVENRKRITSYYNSAFSQNYPVLPLIRYPIRMDKRKELIRQAKRKNVILGTWYDQVIAPKSINFVKMHYKKGSCPQAEKISGEIVTLPTTISEKEAKKIVRVFS